MKLGEVLIAEGIINGKHLKDALDTQLRFGGHLGTCLVELGYVTEERLADALARSYGVPHVPAAAFRKIPRPVINSIPKNVVEKHLCIPVRLRDSVLDVAMIDPKNLGSIDEIRFVSGLAVQSWIAPELRIFQAMEQYYDIPRRFRYVQLCHTLDKDQPVRAAGFVGASDKAPDRAAGESSAAWLIPSPSPSIEAAARSAPSVSIATTAPVAPASSVAHAPIAPSDPLLAVSDLLCGAKSEDQIAELVLGAMYGDVPRRIVFKVRGSNAYLWRTAGVAVDQDVTANVKFPLLSESLFGLLRGDDYYSGPLPSDSAYHGFYASLGIEKPANVVLLPVYLDDQLIAMFYGDGGKNGTIRVDIEHHRRLLAKAALAINVVRTKEKIRAV